jgi:hypothetical protein
MVELKKVMIKDGISYIQMNSYGNVNPEYYLVNDEIPEVAKGQQNYFIYNGEVKSLKVRRTRKGKPTHYELYDKYKGVVQLPETLPIDHFTNEKDYDDEYIEENREFYKMVYAPDEVYFEDIPFEIIDRNSEPKSIPSFVHIDFPNNISKYKEVQHNYPCYITAKDMFDIIYDSILEKIKNYSDIYSWDNYKNIQTLRVSEKIKLTTPHSKVVNYYPSAR